MSSVISKARLPEYAWATLFDAFSVALSYPATSFYEALKDGDFIGVVTEEVHALPDLNGLREGLANLQQTIEQTLKKVDLQELETTYISLFEVNRAQQVLHMYAYLFASGNEDRVTNLRRLQNIYHQYGLMVASDKDSEPLDHLVVQMEFLSYLFVRSGEAQEKQQTDDVALYREAIGSFITELTWVETFSKALSELLSSIDAPSDTCSLYLSLVRMLPLFVNQVRQEYSTGQTV